jgi:hypothetical protein
MKNLILIISIFLLPFFASSQTNCSSLPSHYSSYSEAISKIKNANFTLTDRAYTVNSSFISSAEYFSCDGKTGFLIIGINNRQYLHNNVPKNVWLQFKSANSLGQFYDRNIKGRYLFYL